MVYVLCNTKDIESLILRHVWHMLACLYLAVKIDIFANRFFYLFKYNQK